MLLNQKSSTGNEICIPIHEIKLFAQVLEPNHRRETATGAFWRRFERICGRKSKKLNGRVRTKMNGLALLGTFSCCG